ncbi:MAG: Rab family GTPase [Gammaproteobacteria bacterium]|nr:Rab family GTPase [Gammaproteobacteria bacterium]
MIHKKVGLLGAFAVGKTSLVQRFVRGLFSDKYLTTLGVKIDKKSLLVNNQDVELIVWDLAGEDEFMKVRLSYLRGASGIFLVVDGTRGETLDTALTLQKKVEDEIGRIPFALLINKADLASEWDIDKTRIDRLAQRGWTVLETSAKTGQGVEEAFQLLTAEILEG